jgi:hypothetical protein
MVFLDGAYQTVGAAAPVFRSVAAAESSDLQQLVEQIAGRGRSCAASPAPPSAVRRKVSCA